MKGIPINYRQKYCGMALSFGEPQLSDFVEQRFSLKPPTPEELQEARDDLYKLQVHVRDLQTHITDCVDKALRQGHPINDLMELLDHVKAIQ